MTSDQEPRYRLVDANGNIVGSLYGKPDGSVAIQETDSGADREVALAPDGTFSAPSVETESVSTERTSIGQVVGDLRNDSQNTDAPDGTRVQLEWDTVEREDSDVVDVSTSNDEITILESGVYQLLVAFRWDGDNGWSTGDESRVEFAGDVDIRFEGRKSGTANECYQITTVSQLDDGNSVHVEVRQNSGDTQSISAASVINFFQVVRLG